MIRRSLLTGAGLTGVTIISGCLDGLGEPGREEHRSEEGDDVYGFILNEQNQPHTFSVFVESEDGEVTFEEQIYLEADDSTRLGKIGEVSTEYRIDVNASEYEQSEKVDFHVAGRVSIILSEDDSLIIVLDPID